MYFVINSTGQNTAYLQHSKSREEELPLPWLRQTNSRQMKNYGSAVHLPYSGELRTLLNSSGDYHIYLRDLFYFIFNMNIALLVMPTGKHVDNSILLRLNALAFVTC